MREHDRCLTRRALWENLVETVIATGVIFVVAITALIFSSIVNPAGFTRAMSDVLAADALSALQVALCIATLIPELMGRLERRDPGADGATRIVGDSLEAAPDPAADAGNRAIPSSIRTAADRSLLRRVRLRPGDLETRIFGIP